MKNIFLLLFGLTFYHSSYSQSKTVQFSNISINEGLSQSFVNDILCDKNGFIWIATQDGLNKYNGYDFDIFYHDGNDSTTISDNYITKIIEDENQNLWIGTEQGLCFYNRNLNKFKSVNIPNFKNLVITNLLIDSKGILWIGTEKKGIIAYDIKYNYFLKNTFLENEHITSILEDKNKKIWVATENKGIFTINKDRNVISNLFTDSTTSENLNKINTIIESDSLIWIGAQDNLYCYNNTLKSFTRKIEFKDIKISSLIQDSLNLWIGTNNGLYFLETFRSNNLTTLYQRDENKATKSLINNNILSLEKDFSGIIWIGTNDGISKLDPHKQFFKHFNNIGASNVKEHDFVWAINQTIDGIIWIGTSNGLVLFDPKINHYENYTNISSSSNFKNNKTIFSICVDKENNVWLGTIDRLVKVNRNSSNPYRLSFQETNYISAKDFGGSENKVYHILEDRKGFLWISTQNGLYRINIKDKKSLFLKHNSENPFSLSSGKVRVTYEDQKGNVWVGTSNGLNKVKEFSDDSIYFKQYIHEPNNSNTLNNNEILSICELNKILWIGTYGGGLNKFDPKTESFSHFTQKDGLSNNVVYGILADNNDNLWLSTNKGICRFNTKNKLFTKFDKSDGLQSNEYNLGAYFKSNTNTFYFGGINGFNAFNPENIHQNPIAPKIVLTDFKLFNKSIEIGEKSYLKQHISNTTKIELPHNKNNITIEYTGIHYTSTDQITYFYKLEGFDEDWMFAENQRFIHYSNLDAGDYIFKVKAISSDGISSDELSLIITISKPYWKTWWFLFVVLGGIGLMTYITIRGRVLFLKNQQAKLERLVTEKTAEIINQKTEIEQKNKELQQERDRAEMLLLNVLPKQSVSELKTKGSVKARSYRSATVMFTDFVGFTKLAEKLRPKELVEELDHYFVEYDSIIEKHKIEKIKTIGDAYMCVSGVPIRNRTHAIDMVLAGLEIQRFMNKNKKEKEAHNLPYWQIRLGIHSGELIAGIIGTKKFAYDIWGDTVNVANRMEMSGEPGKVNISEDTYSHIKKYFDCTQRGEVKAKNKGEIVMYFVDNLKEEYSVNGDKITPLSYFYDLLAFERLTKINYLKVEKQIIEKLKQLDKKLVYHDIAHSIRVADAIVRIAIDENVRGTELILLRTAALLHDIGFLKQYDNNEMLAYDVAEEILPNLGYSNEHMEIIKGLIQSTIIGVKPKNNLEEIMCDADLEYIGMDDFHDTAKKLRVELKSYGKNLDDKEWYNFQLKFLYAHSFFSKSVKKNRQTKKLKHIKDIEAWLDKL